MFFSARYAFARRSRLLSGRPWRFFMDAADSFQQRLDLLWENVAVEEKLIIYSYITLRPLLTYPASWLSFLKVFSAAGIVLLFLGTNKGNAILTRTYCQIKKGKQAQGTSRCSKTRLFGKDRAAENPHCPSSCQASSLSFSDLVYTSLTCTDNGLTNARLLCLDPSFSK